MVRIIALAVLLSIGCGVDPATVAIHSSPIVPDGGSARLVPLSNKYATPGADYVLPIVGQFYDTQLATPCAVMVASDSYKRCLPLSDAQVNGNYFGDAACTKLLAQSVCDRPANGYALHAESPELCGNFGPRVTVYSVETTLAVAGLFTKVMGLCVPTSPPYATDFYFVVGTVKASDFALVTPSFSW